MTKTARIKLPFGLNRNNHIVHIADVESGKKCNCVCPSCLAPLTAAKGNHNQHHFKHAVDNVCESGLESAIHLAAKQEIFRRKKITLPEFISTASAIDSRKKEHTDYLTVVKDGQIIAFDKVVEEKELNRMRADILAIKSNRSLIIEVFYRHKVELQKIDKIKTANISAIEINLSDLTPEDVKDMETFWLCINDTKRIQWLHNVKAQNITYPTLVTRLKIKINELEKKYAKEKSQLNHAIEELKTLRGRQHEKIIQKIEQHPAWKLHSKYLNLSPEELPDFLNLEIPDSDWIFCCDRRVWQTAFYSFFVRFRGKPFSLQKVETWLNTKAMCKSHPCVKIVNIYGKHYPELIPSDFSGNLPSAWKTLHKYFKELCRLGILEFSPNISFSNKDSWFKILSKMPRSQQSI